MNKRILLIICLVLLAVLSRAQTCQNFDMNITSTDPVITDADSMWIDVCQGTEITFTGAGDYPNSGTTYEQSDATTEFIWRVNNGDSEDVFSGTNMTEFSHTFNEEGGYFITLEGVDMNDCDNSNLEQIRVRVSLTPYFIGTDILQDTICIGDQIDLAGQGTVFPTSWSIPIPTEVAGTTYLPDGSGVEYTTSITHTIFGPNQTLESATDLLAICANIEHSYMGDLDIWIECPSGEIAYLFEQACGGGWFGEAIDGDSSPTPGVGYDYCWTMYAGSTMEDNCPGSGSTLPSGDYLPVDDFSNLVGCDMNGDWTIHILDNLWIDNGYIFSWQLIFDPSIIPDDLWTIENTYNYTDSYWTGDGIISDVDGNAVAQPTTTGDLLYEFTAVDDFGCEYDTVVTVHVLPDTDPTCCSQPFANAGPDDSICGPTYTLHTDLDLPVNTVLWTQIAGPGTTNFAGNEASTDPTVTVNQYGTYTYTLSEQNLSPTCSDIDTVEITFYEIPNSNFSTTVIPCNGNVSTISYNGNATSGASYNWNFDSGLVITGSGQGPYQVAWADAGVHTITLSVEENGCSSNESSETVLNPEELTHVLTTQDDPCNGTCEGLASVQVDGGTMPYTYSWGPTSVSSNLCAGAYSITVTDDNGCETSENFVINEPAPIVITNVSTQDITCFNQANGEIIIAAAGGYGTLIYTWSDGGSGAQRLNLPAGMYGLTITDQNGCFITDQYTLTQPDELLISISPDQAHCEGTTATITSQALGGTEPYTYYWDSGSGFAPASNVITVAPSTTTTYVVYVQDANGCETAPVSMTMTISPQMYMTLTTEDNRCHASCDGEAQLFVDGGIPPINYSWSAPGAVYSDLCAGVYDVTITDMLGCQVDTVFQIHEPPQLFGDVYTTDATCNGYDNGEAFVEVVGGVPDYTYLWPDGSTEDDITAEAGVYTVTVADAHDCRIELDAVIGEPDRIELTMGSGDRWICKSNSTQLLAYAVGGTPIPGGSYDFIWSGTDGSEYIIHNPEVSPDTTTVYTVYAIDDNSCRSEEHEVTVNVYPDLMIESLTTSYDTICIGDPAIVEAVVSGGNGGPYQLTLHDGQVVPAPFTVYPMETTYYIVTLDDACGTPSVQDSVLINVMPRPANSFVSDKVEGCPPFSVKFNEMSEDEGQTYLWNFGDDGFAEVKNPTHVYETPGFYPVTLTVTSEFGCAKTVTVDHMIHVFEKPLADFYTDQDYVSVLDPEIQFFNISENADSAFWFFGDGDSSLFINPIHNFVNIGSYDVMLIAESIRGCRDTIVKTISVRDEFTFYAPTAFTPNGDGDNDFFMVTGNGIDPNEFTMRVYDRWGELVFETDAYDPDRPVGSAWDGTYQGDRSKGDRLLHHGVYSWYCRFKDFTGVWHEYEGTVTLMR